MKVSQSVTPEDYDHLLHNTAAYVPQAVSAVDLALRNRITETRNEVGALRSRVVDRVNLVKQYLSGTPQERDWAKQYLKDNKITKTQLDDLEDYDMYYGGEKRKL